MSFPVDPLVVKIEISFGADLKADPATWVYIDVTGDWQPDRAVAATIGRADAAATSPPAKMTFTLKNVGGKYTKGNPLSQFWPHIRKNTPCRVTIDPGTGHVRVYTMYVTQWIPRWGSSGDSGRQPLVQVVCNGIRRRLTQGSSPLRSPLYRATTALSPVAHWALEDGSDATQAGAALTSGSPLVVSQGTVKFASVDAPGAERAPDIAAGMLSGPLPSGVTPTSWALHLAFRATRPNVGAEAHSYPLLWTTANGYVWAVYVSQDEAPGTAYVRVGLQSSLQLKGTDLNILRSVFVPSTYDGQWHSVLVAVSMASPTSTKMTTTIDGTYTDTITVSPHVYSQLAGSLRGPNTEAFSMSNTDSLAVSSIAFFSTAPDPVALYKATQGYAGEPAAGRIARLCAEEGVAAVVSTAATAQMGPQRPGPFVGLLDEASDADGGILLDGLGPGFTYLARADAYNLPIALTVDMAGRQFKAPFEPLDDDANIVNDETVTRTGGSSARYVDQTGPAGVDAIQRYDDSKTLNVYSDADLLAQAAWRVHLGTAADSLRFPGVAFDLHTGAGSALIEPWLISGVRKRVQVTNPPAEYGLGPIDLLVEGYTETIKSRREWSVQANASPYEPWIVWQLGSLTTGRVDSASTTVRTTVPAGAASVQVNVGGVPWTTNPARMPLDLWIDGIKVRVTAISGAASPQTLTVDPTTVTKQLTAGRPVRLWQPAVVAL